MKVRSSVKAFSAAEAFLMTEAGFTPGEVLHEFRAGARTPK